MQYKEKIDDLLKKHMTERAFKLWQGIDKRLPNIWEKPSSSTGKYHKKMNGEVPSQAEHVYHMLFSAAKIARMFGYKNKSADLDKLLLGIVLHDSLKYGAMGNRTHTDRHHDKEAADMIASNSDTFKKILSESQFYDLEEMVRFHSGQWSTDVRKGEKFNFKNFTPETLFVHMLDMMSTNDLIQTDIRD